MRNEKRPSRVPMLRGVVVGLAFVFCSAPQVVRADDLYAAQKEDLRRIKQRMIDDWTLRGLPDSPLVRRELELLDERVDWWLAVEGGYWSRWTEVGHPQVSHGAAAFAVPAELARAYGAPASRHYRSPRVLAAIESGLRHLSRFAYPGCKQPGNWWAWQIGMPMYITPTLILVENDLDRDLFRREVETVQYLLKVGDDAKLAGAFVRPEQAEPGKTNMNALWHKGLCLDFGVLVENPAMAGKWAGKAFGEMGMPGEGPLQADWSYKFHGEKPMWAYGRAFLLEYAMLIGWYDGTYLGPRAEQTERYAAMLEHFVNGFLYRGRLCPAIIGREISRGPLALENPAIPAALAVMARSRCSRAEEFARLLARESPQTDPAAAWITPIDEPDRRWMARPAFSETGVAATEPAPPVNDIFAYPDSDFLEITRPKWAVGIKMHSCRNAGYESINGENLQGWFLSHGSMFHYLRGDEWDGCWPTLDWTRLPGTTVSDQVKKQNQSAFVGMLRASDRVALAAMELKRGGFTARKSWLVDGDVIVCMGSEIDGPGRVETTVLNQPVREGSPALIDGSPAPAEPCERVMNVRSVWVDGMGYVLPGGAQVRVIRGGRTSDWGSIRDAKRHRGGETVTRHYVTVVIEHGPAARSYRYLMLPNVEQSAWSACAEAVRQNYDLGTEGPHTVRSRDGRFQSVVLWTAGAAGPIRADRGCLALGVGGKWWAADPAWDERPLELSLTGRQMTLRPAKGRPVPIAQ